MPKFIRSTHFQVLYTEQLWSSDSEQSVRQMLEGGWQFIKEMIVRWPRGVVAGGVGCVCVCVGGGGVRRERKEIDNAASTS